MGANTKLLRNRIKSVDSTLHLTKAMGLVASSKIRRANERMLTAKEYKKSLEEVMEALTSSPECQKSSFMRARGEKIRMIVIAGDRGLAGGYNANVFRLVKTLPPAEIIPIGKRACDKYGKGYPSAEGFDGACAKELARVLCADFEAGKFDSLCLVGTRFHSILSQEPYLLHILPLEKPKEKKSISAVFEPDEFTILQSAVSEYVAGMIAGAVRESFASEVAARKMAMDNAGKNAGQMIEALSLEYNRARQGAITQEITEIIAGSGA